MSIYTKTGDKGSTALVGGSRVSKADLRVDTYGTVDELNAALSLAERATLGADNRALLEAVQYQLFYLGAEGSFYPDDLPVRCCRRIFRRGAGCS